LTPEALAIAESPAPAPVMEAVSLADDVAGAATAAAGAKAKDEAKEDGEKDGDVVAEEKEAEVGPGAEAKEDGKEDAAVEDAPEAAPQESATASRKAPHSKYAPSVSSDSKMNPVRALQKYIASFGGATVGKGRRHELGKAPPCRSYQQLVVLYTMENSEKAISNSTCKNDLVVETERLKVFKAAYTELQSMAKAAAARLKTCVKKAKEDAAKHETEVAADVKGQAKKKQKTNSLFEFVNYIGNAKEITSHLVQANRGEACSIDTPVIIRISETDFSGAFAKEGVLYKSALALGQVFRTGPERTTTGRTQRKLLPDVF